MDVAAQIVEDIKRGETKKLEFKGMLPENHVKFLKTAVAFSNGIGGKILFGVNDDGTVAGIPDETIFAIKDSITNSVIDSCEPQIVPDIFIVTVDGKSVIVLQVSPGLNCPYYLKSEGRIRGTYIRVGATSVLARRENLKALELRGNKVSFDSLERPSMKVDDDVLETLREYLSQYKGEKTLGNLIAMGVVKDTSSGYIATNAYALLTANPFKYATVKCARFRGTDDTVFVDRKEFDGSILDQATDALDFIINHINVGAKIDDLVREDIFEIPKDALREAVVNALIHRDYLLEGRSITIFIFDDRVEIESPGQPLGIDADDILSGRSVVRNEVIAAVFKSIGLFESYGTGIRRIVKSCKAAGLPEPQFIEDGEYFKVLFRRNPTLLNPKTKRDQADAIIHVIADNGSLSQAQISNASGVPLSRVKKIMAELQKEGVIERIGSRRDASWKICERS